MEFREGSLKACDASGSIELFEDGNHAYHFKKASSGRIVITPGNASTPSHDPTVNPVPSVEDDYLESYGMGIDNDNPHMARLPKGRTYSIELSFMHETSNDQLEVTVKMV